jgi:hypothetical protein
VEPRKEEEEEEDLFKHRDNLIFTLTHLRTFNLSRRMSSIVE